jgi:hypothetical protein
LHAALNTNGKFKKSTLRWAGRSRGELKTDADAEVKTPSLPKTRQMLRGWQAWEEWAPGKDQSVEP